MARLTFVRPTAAGPDDTYISPVTAAIAGNWDHMISVFVDARGNDTYHGEGIALGAATITSFAAFVDGDGVDRYRTGSSLSFGNCGHSQDIGNKKRRKMGADMAVDAVLDHWGFLILSELPATKNCVVDRNDIEIAFAQFLERHAHPHRGGPMP